MIFIYSFTPESLKSPFLCQSLCLMMVESFLVIKENDFCSEEASVVLWVWCNGRHPPPPSNPPQWPLGEELGCEVRNSESINYALLVKVFELITHWLLMINPSFLSLQHQVEFFSFSETKYALSTESCRHEKERCISQKISRVENLESHHAFPSQKFSDTSTGNLWHRWKMNFV